MKDKLRLKNVSLKIPEEEVVYNWGRYVDLSFFPFFFKVTVIKLNSISQTVHVSKFQRCPVLNP